MKENYARGEGRRGLALRWNRGGAAHGLETDETVADLLADDVQEVGDDGTA